MKKRIIVALFFIVGITSIPLILSIFKLYTEAEKVQRSIFVNEVLTAGDAIVNQIDATILNDTVAMAEAVGKLTAADTTDVVSSMHTRKFLLDSVTQQPIGVIKSVIFVKENEYILAAKSIGAPTGMIIRNHILPNCISVIIISTALQIPSAIFTESYLSFVGLGVQAPMPSLGSLANSARGGLQSYPYKLLFPALTICLIVLSFNLLGDGLRDAFDPKLKR